MVKLFHRAATRGVGVAVCQLALVAAGAAAQAAEKPKPPPEGKSAVLGSGSSDLPVLTRSELRACLAQQDKLTAMQADVMKEQAALDAEKTAIEQQRIALKAELDTLDRTSAPAVDGYNAKSAEQDKRIDAYNQRGAPFNAKATEWKDAHAAWDHDCSNRRYQENDLIIIKAGR